MLIAPHARSTIAALLRLLAAWLAVIVLVQGLAAAQALGGGPLHRHREGVSPAQHAHHHDGVERHHHDALDNSVVVSEADATFDADAFAITAALALMALAVTRASPDAPRQVLRAARAWAWRISVPAALRKPPRLG